MKRREEREVSRRPTTTKIDVSTLFPGPAGSKLERDLSWQDDKVGRTHNWTRQQGAGAGLKSHFKVVGIAPSTTRTSAKKSTKPSKLGVRWRVTRAPEKWEEDPSIIYVTTVSVKSELVDFFPGKYTDTQGILEEDEKAALGLWIAGPRDAVIRTLTHQMILPAAPAAEYERWIDRVAITYDNYEQNPEYARLVEEDKKYEKAAEAVQVEVQRINDLILIGKYLRGKRGVIHIADVNGAVIGKYGDAVLKKAPTNVFTDFLVKQIRKKQDLSNVIIDISGLTTGTDSKVYLQKYPAEVDIAKGKYTSTRKRPLIGLILDITVDGQTYELPNNLIWTSRPEPIEVLFNEIEAVNKAGRDVSYSALGSKDTVKNSVQDLLRRIKPRGAAKEKEEEAEEPEVYAAGVLYG